MSGFSVVAKPLLGLDFNFVRVFRKNNSETLAILPVCSAPPFLTLFNYAQLRLFSAACTAASIKQLFRGPARKQTGRIVPKLCTASIKAN